MHSPYFSPFPSPGYRVSGKEVEVRGSGSPSVPAPSAGWLLQSPVNPEPCGTFSWLTSKSPFSPFLPGSALLLPKPCGKKEHPKTTWSSFLSLRTAWSSLFTSPKLHDPLPSPPKPRGPLSSLSEPRCPPSLSATSRF